MIVSFYRSTLEVWVPNEDNFRSLRKVVSSEISADFRKINVLESRVAGAQPELFFGEGQNLKKKLGGVKT